MDSKLEISLLYDFYKELLNESQQQVIELSVNDDLSLSEAAQLLGISRQGVRDSLSRAAKKLTEYESRLHLYADYQARRKIADRMIADIRSIRSLTRDESVSAICERMIADTRLLLEKEDSHGV